MKLAVRDLREAFHVLYKNLNDKKFRKSADLNYWNETDLLLLVRCFLLGCFQNVTPEFTVRLPSSPSKKGRIDFLVGDIGVEFAVRAPDAPRSPISALVNVTELKKLMMHDGPSLLVLFDFSKNPMSVEQIEEFRDWPSLGRGNFKKHAVNVSYHYTDDEGCGWYHDLNVRVRT